MKLTFISDTHSEHSKLNLGSGSVLIHCGDLTKSGSIEELKDFSSYMKNQDFEHKIVVAGNHDFCLEDERKSEAEGILAQNGIIYLNDNGVEINGLHFWGSPIQPTFFNWAFNRDRGLDIKSHWDLIPENTNILITHGPPFGILDQCKNGQNVGCRDLLNKVKKLNLKVHAFGHIHESYGIETQNKHTYLNASSLDENYKMTNEPITLEL